MAVGGHPEALADGPVELVEDVAQAGRLGRVLGDEPAADKAGRFLLDRGVPEQAGAALVQELPGPVLFVIERAPQHAMLERARPAARLFGRDPGLIPGAG